MFARIPQRGTHPAHRPAAAAARLRRLAAALAAVTCTLLASAAVMPAAWAVIRDPAPAGRAAQAPAGRRGHRGRHARLADHPDRARRRPGRGHRGRPCWTGRGPPAGQPPRYPPCEAPVRACTGRAWPWS